MKGLTAMMLGMAWVGATSAFQPRTGHWWNPAESGRAFNVDIQDGALVGNDGVIAIDFASEIAATETLTGGRTTNIQPFNFAVGDPPQEAYGASTLVRRNLNCPTNQRRLRTSIDKHRLTGRRAEQIEGDCYYEAI